MNYYWFSIPGFIFIIHLTVAASPFHDFRYIFDELCEINVRMGEAINRAKDMAQTDKLKISDDERNFIRNTLDVVEDNYHRIVSAIANAYEHLNKNDFNGTLDDDTKDPNNVTEQLLDWGAYDSDARTVKLPEGQVDPKGENNENSTVINALDLNGNQWNQENVTENKVTTEGTVPNELDDKPNVDDDLNKNENNTYANAYQGDIKRNQQHENQPINITEDQIDYSKQVNDDHGHDHDHDQEIDGDKNYNGDKIVKESDSWFGRAIDSVFNWFG